MELKIDDNDLQKGIEDFLASKFPKVLEEGLTKAGLVVESAAKQNCPVDTGQLRGSINSQVETNGNSGEVVVGSGVEYAPYVEVGTGIYTAGGRKDGWYYVDASGQGHFTNGQRPQPFLKPAVESNIRNILAAFEGLI